MHEYPDISDFADRSGYGFRPHESPDSLSSRVRSPEWKKKKSSTNQITTCGWVNPDIFESDDVANSCPVSHRTITETNMAAQQHLPPPSRALWRMF